MAAEQEESWDEWARFMGILQDKWEKSDKAKTSFHQVHTEALAEFEATVKPMDEFEIQATGHPSEPDRIWTRSKLDTAQWIADQAIRSLAYGKAVVVNIRPQKDGADKSAAFGGHRSDPLYTVEGMQGKVASCRIELET